MLVDKRSLDAHVRIRTRATATRVCVYAENFIERHIVVVEDWSKAELVVRWPECRIAFEVHEFGSDILRKNPLITAAKDIVLTGIARRLAAHRRRHFAELVHRIRNQAEIEEPVLTMHRPVSLQN